MHWIFQPKNLHGNVVLNFRRNPINDLVAFAEGYHHAGKRLAEQLEASPNYADYDGYPILFFIPTRFGALCEGHYISWCPTTRFA